MSILQGFYSALQPRHWSELCRYFRNHKWEANDDGDILISHAKIGGVFHTTAEDGLGEVATHNKWTIEGLNYLLSLGVVSATTKLGTFYIAPFGASGNVTVSETWKHGAAPIFASTAGEYTSEYSEANRVTFVPSTVASGSVNNTAGPAVITAATTNLSIWGVGLASIATKGSTSSSHYLLAAASYTTARVLPSIGDTLGVKYTLSLANS